MSYENLATPITLINTANDLTPKMRRLLEEKKAARQFRERKHIDWNDTYELFRNKIRTNRLTQRQTVNIPLMKETIKTLLSKIDDPPTVEWKELGGELDKQIVLQELWQRDFERLNLEGLDIQDKKTVLLYGRGFKKLNWIDNGVAITALDIFDIVIDPMVDPLDIETARFIVHQNLFRTLREILADPRYSMKAKDALRDYSTSGPGIVQTAQNKLEWDKKQLRLKAMQLYSYDFPSFAGGDTIVNITEHYTNTWNVKEQKFERRVCVYAEDSIELMDEKLEDLIGITQWPFVTWGEDIETNDFWSDGIGDLVRTPNKILNIWFSQLVENRTLRNFQMHWYDATIQGYTPQTYMPGPGVMLPAPGDPNKTIMPVAIDGLDETLKAVEFLTQVVERATSATNLEKGQEEQGATTLGEVQLLIGAANERVQSMAKFYRRSWYELAMKWYGILDANFKGKVTIYKTSRTGKEWPKDVRASDWKTEEGYKAIVRSTSEQEQEHTKSVQKFMAILQQFPENPALKKIAQKRMLELVDLTPEEIKEVQDAEQKSQEAMMAQGNDGQPQQTGQPQQQMSQTQPQPQGQPQAPQPEDLGPQIQKLKQLTA